MHPGLDKHHRSFSISGHASRQICSWILGAEGSHEHRLTLLDRSLCFTSLSRETLTAHRCTYGAFVCSK